MSFAEDVRASVQRINAATIEAHGESNARTKAAAAQWMASVNARDGFEMLMREQAVIDAWVKP